MSDDRKEALPNVLQMERETFEQQIAFAVAAFSTIILKGGLVLSEEQIQNMANDYAKRFTKSLIQRNNV